MAKKKVVEKEYICHINDDIRYTLNALVELDFTKATIEEIPDMQETLMTKLQHALTRLEEAKDRGISMETRLFEYRNAINALGYIRNQ